MKDLGIQGLVMSWFRDCLGCHWSFYGCGGSHTVFFDDLGGILLLAETKDLIVLVSVDLAPKRPRSWSEVFDLKPLGERSLEVGKKFAGFSRQDGVVDIHSQDVDNFFDEKDKDSWVDEGLGEAEGHEPGGQEGVPSLWGFSDFIECFIQVAY